MNVIRASVVLALVVCLSGVAAALPGQPDFSPGLFADGKMWGTKGAAPLSPPNGHNESSFDKLFVIVNGSPGQLPVAEAAPGNPSYNGGRWYTHTAMWTQDGMNAYSPDPLPVLMSYDDVMEQADLGYLSIAPGPPNPGPPAFFECPLLPVK